MNSNRPNRKRLITGLLCLALAIAWCLTGCSAPASSESETSTTTDAPSSTATPVAKTTTATTEPTATTTLPDIPLDIPGAQLEQGYFDNTLFVFSVPEDPPQLRESRLYGLADASGEVVIPAEYTVVEPLTPERFIVTTGHPLDDDVQESLVDQSGAVVYPPCGGLSSNELAFAEDGHYTGSFLIAGDDEGAFLIDLNGSRLTEGTWERILFDPYRQDLALAADSEGHCYALDETGAVACDFSTQVLTRDTGIGSLVLTDTYAGENLTHRCGLQKADGTVILEPKYTSVTVYSPDLIVVSVVGGYNRCRILDGAGRETGVQRYRQIEFWRSEDGTVSRSGIASREQDATELQWYLIAQDGTAINEQPYLRMRFIDAQTIEVEQQKNQFETETFRIDLDGNRL